MALAAAADPVADDARQRVEAGGAVDAAFADLLAEELGDRAARAGAPLKSRSIAGLALERRHGHHRLEQLARGRESSGAWSRIATSRRVPFGVDRARHADRLVRRAEGRVAADLDRDHVPHPADGGDVVRSARLGQPPVEVQLALALRRDAAGGDLEGRRAEVLREMLALGGDVAVVEIDEHHLRLDDILGPGVARGCDGAGHDEERHAGVGGPERLRRQFRGKLAVRLDERRVRRPVGPPFSARARTGTQPSQ